MKKKLIAVNNIFVNGFKLNKGGIIEFKEGDGTTPSVYYTSDGIEVPSYIDITNKLNFVPFAPKFKTLSTFIGELEFALLSLTIA